MKYYLAYGSNLNIKQMTARCPGAKPFGRAYIPNRRLAFKGSSSGNYLTIVKSKMEMVPVVVWEINGIHEKNLDRYEGYPVFYYKEDFEGLQVNGFDGKTYLMDCFAYTMVDNTEYGMPSGTYYMVCSEGYKDFKLQDIYLEKALKYTEKMMNKKSKKR